MATAAWQGQQTPSHYPSVSLDKTKPRAPSFVERSKSIRFKPLKKSDNPDMGTYKPTIDVLSSRPKAQDTKFSKARPRNYIDNHVRAKNFMPSPAAYDISKADRVVTLGARSSYK